MEKNDLVVIGQLNSGEQWSRYGDMLAGEDTVDFGAVQQAYAAARLAAEALLAGAPAKEVRDQYCDEFDNAMATLRPFAKLTDNARESTSGSP